MIKILYFASFRERLGMDSEELEIHGLTDVGALLNKLQSRGAVWERVFADDQRVMVAVNQEMSDEYAVINDGDEIAFFPPVTGG